MAARNTLDDETPVYVMSIAAELAGMHAQTLRQYDRLGLVKPQRTRGGGRRYSARDVMRLREVQRLSQDERISLAGIQRIMELEHQMGALRERVAELLEQNRALHEALEVRSRVFATGPSGETLVMRPGTRPRQDQASTTVAVWRPLPF